MKFVLDSLNKYAYLDDSQIAILTSAKLYTEEEQRVEVRIRQLNDNDNISYGNFN